MRNDKDGFVLAFWLTIAAFGSSACEPDVSDLFAFRGAPVLEDMTIRTADGRSFRGEVATIDVRAPLPKGPSAVASIAISAADARGHGLSFAFDLAPERLLEQSFSVTIGPGPESCTVAHLSSKGAEIVEAGSLLLSTEKGRLWGQFRTNEATFSMGTIDGRYVVRCLVTPEMLGQQPNGETSEGTWILVEDEAKASAFCKAFAEF
jgi:hypothetical protein